MQLLFQVVTTDEVKSLVGLFGGSCRMFSGFEVGTQGDTKEPESADLLHGISSDEDVGMSRILLPKDHYQLFTFADIERGRGFSPETNPPLSLPLRRPSHHC